MACEGTDDTAAMDTAQISTSPDPAPVGLGIPGFCGSRAFLCRFSLLKGEKRVRFSLSKLGLKSFSLLAEGPLPARALLDSP